MYPPLSAAVSGHSLPLPAATLTQEGNARMAARDAAAAASWALGPHRERLPPRVLLRRVALPEALRLPRERTYTQRFAVVAQAGDDTLLHPAFAAGTGTGDNASNSDHNGCDTDSAVPGRGHGSYIAVAAAGPWLDNGTSARKAAACFARLWRRAIDADLQRGTCAADCDGERAAPALAAVAVKAAAAAAEAAAKVAAANQKADEFRIAEARKVIAAAEARCAAAAAGLPPAAAPKPSAVMGILPGLKPIDPVEVARKTSEAAEQAASFAKAALAAAKAAMPPAGPIACPLHGDVIIVEDGTPGVRARDVMTQGQQFSGSGGTCSELLCAGCACWVKGAVAHCRHEADARAASATRATAAASAGASGAASATVAAVDAADSGLCDSCCTACKRACRSARQVQRRNALTEAVAEMAKCTGAACAAGREYAEYASGIAVRGAAPAAAGSGSPGAPAPPSVGSPAAEHGAAPHKVCSCAACTEPVLGSVPCRICRRWCCRTADAALAGAAAGAGAAAAAEERPAAASAAVHARHVDTCGGCAAGDLCPQRRYECAATGTVRRQTGYCEYAAVAAGRAVDDGIKRLMAAQYSHAAALRACARAEINVAVQEARKAARDASLPFGQDVAGLLAAADRHLAAAIEKLAAVEGSPAFASFAHELMEVKLNVAEARLIVAEAPFNVEKRKKSAAETAAGTAATAAAAAAAGKGTDAAANAAASSAAQAAAVCAAAATAAAAAERRGQLPRAKALYDELFIIPRPRSDPSVGTANLALSEAREQVAEKQGELIEAREALRQLISPRKAAASLRATSVGDGHEVTLAPHAGGAAATADATGAESASAASAAAAVPSGFDECYSRIGAGRDPTEDLLPLMLFDGALPVNSEGAFTLLHSSSWIAAGNAKAATQMRRWDRAARPTAGSALLQYALMPEGIS